MIVLSALPAMNSVARCVTIAQNNRSHSPGARASANRIPAARSGAPKESARRSSSTRTIGFTRSPAQLAKLVEVFGAASTVRRQRGRAAAHAPGGGEDQHQHCRTHAAWIAPRRGEHRERERNTEQRD